MLRPLDLQVNVVQTPQVSRVEHSNDTKMLNDQALFQSEMQKQIVKDNQNVIQSQKTEQNAVDKDGKNARDDRKREKKKSKRTETKAGEAQKNSTSMFDVKI